MIDKETKNLKKELSNFYKESSNWMNMYDSLNEALKVRCIDRK